MEKKNEIERNQLSLTHSARTQKERENANEDDMYRMRHQCSVEINRSTEFE